MWKYNSQIYITTTKSYFGKTDNRRGKNYSQMKKLKVHDVFTQYMSGKGKKAININYTQSEYRIPNNCTEVSIVDNILAS